MRRGLRPVPVGFEYYARRMGKHGLAEMFGAGYATVERWLAELGIDKPEQPGAIPKPVEAVCESGEILRFPSAKAAARELYGTKEYINHAAKYGCRAYGMVWRYAE